MSTIKFNDYRDFLLACEHFVKAGIIFNADAAELVIKFTGGY